MLKGIYNTCATHTQANRQASRVRFLFAGFFGMSSTSINKILLDAQISEYNKKLATKPNTYDLLQYNTVSTPKAPPHIHSLQNIHPLSLVPQNYRNLYTSNH